MANRFNFAIVIILCLFATSLAPVSFNAAQAKNSASDLPGKKKKKEKSGDIAAASKKDNDSDKDDDSSKDDDSDKNKSDKASSDKTGSEKGKSAKSKDKDEDEPKLSITEHSTTIGGKTIKYKATAGYMVLKDYGSKNSEHGSGSDKDKSDKDKDKDKKKEHKALAKVFFIAYTREDAGSSAKRPVTFSFNGGPGSASIWLHMGGLGPRRSVLSERGEALPPPYRLEDNNYSWLDASDLVFIDPVSTGFSRPEPDEDVNKFHGYREDIESVGEFIRLYTTKYQRWSSPKFIVGESYGTTRAAGLSDFLQKRYGMYMNGIVLVSTVLNFGTIDFNPGNDTPFALFMPSYVATAWYHKRLSPEMQSKSLPEVLKDAEQFAAHDYLQALFQGDSLGEDKKQQIADRLSVFVGLPSNYLKSMNCRLPDSLFFTHLLMDKNRQLGRYDSRFTGIRYSPGVDDFEFDPSAEAVTGTFTATFNDYVRRELHYESELPYETIANVWPWSWKTAQ
ncbi:MAG: hypothetical protein K2X81_11075, partial [Candidatus Obscuribacterales bacterium]|nr:hypothetical protein [Candidatus Obscuribacterales bacterium]